MTEILNNIHLALPEIIVLVTAVIALLADLFARHRCKSIAFICATSGLIIAGVVSFIFLGQYNSIIFQGLFISDDTAQLMKIVICITVFLCFFYSRHYIDERQMPSGDYYVLGLFSTLGMMVLVSAHSLLTIYASLCNDRYSAD